MQEISAIQDVEDMTPVERSDKIRRTVVNHLDELGLSFKTSLGGVS